MSSPSSAPPAIIKCIYCKQDAPPSREHVLARSLGGDATRWIDCVECNTKELSPLNQALAERSLVAFSRVAETPADAFDARLGGDHFQHDAANDLYAEIRLSNGLRPVPYPQIHIRLDTRKAAVIAGDRAGVEALVAYVDKRQAKGNLRSVFVKTGPAEKCTTARIVLHRERDAFVRVARDEDKAAFFDLLEEGWPKLRSEMVGGESFVAESIPNPSIEVRMTMRLDDVFRAVAMTAFNVVAMDVGVEFALRPEFDPLREYVRGRDIRHPEHLAAGEVAVDTRFVTAVPYGEPPLVATDGHAVTVTYDHPDLLAYVTLYGAHSFVVRLARIELSEPVLVSREFSTVRDGNAALTVEALYERMTRTRPGDQT